MLNAPAVFVVDDDEAVRDALVVLGETMGLEVEAYASAQAFLDAYDPARRGCLVLDVRMPGISGLMLLEQLEAHDIELPVIFLTSHADVPMAVRAFKGGAVDFLEKPFDNEVLLACIRKAIGRDLEARRRTARRRDVEGRLALLTPRERAVVDELIAGRPHKVIAARLCMSLPTMEAHRKSIMNKLQARNYADLVRLVVAARAQGASDGEG